MPCGEVPWVGSFLLISTLVRYTERLWRADLCTCPFWTPLPGSESDGSYTAHAWPTFGDFGNTNCIRALLYQDSRTDLSSGLTNAVSSTAGASRSTSSSTSLNHPTFVVNVVGARFATHYPGIALIVASSLLWSPPKDAFPCVDFRHHLERVRDWSETDLDSGSVTDLYELGQVDRRQLMMYPHIVLMHGH